jgi:NADH dehydrogenase
MKNISAALTPHGDLAFALTRREAPAHEVADLRGRADVAQASNARRHAPVKPRPRVVIVGAGFGGLSAAGALRDADVDITLVDRRNFHLFQPLLYQVATAALSPGHIAWPIRSLFRDQPNVTVLMAEVGGVDLAARTVTADGTTLSYDFLILATGATHAYFGHDGWAAHAPGLKTIDDALSIRQKFLSGFERAERAADPDREQALLTAVIIGGGPTGVEVAGAAAELAHRTLSSEFRNIDPAKARIILLEAGPRVLAAFPEALSEVARRSLESIGVEVRTGAMVAECDEHGVTLADGQRINAGTIIWAAGVSASPAADWIGAEQDRAGRARVGPDLALAGHPEVFVIGDTASVVGPSGRPVPGIAPAAKQMGAYVGKLITGQVTGRTPPKPFTLKNPGDLATIGRKSAVVSMSNLRLTGLLGWLLWCVAHVWFLIGFRSRMAVAFEWVWSYLTAQRGARLISEHRESAS